MAPAFRKSSFGLLLLISDPLPHSLPTSLTFMLRQGVLHGKEICQGCEALCPSLAVVLHWQRETRGCHPSVPPPASSSTWGCSPLQAVCEVPCVLINQHRQVTKKSCVEKRLYENDCVIWKLQHVACWRSPQIKCWMHFCCYLQDESPSIVGLALT